MIANTERKKNKVLRDTADISPRFGFRKLSVGLAGMLLSTTLFLGGRTSQVHADTIDDSANGDSEAVNTDEQDSNDLARPQTQTQAQPVQETQSQSAVDQAISSNAQTSQAVSNQANYNTNVQSSDQTVTSQANSAVSQPDYSQTHASPVQEQPQQDQSVNNQSSYNANVTPTQDGNADYSQVNQATVQEQPQQNDQSQAGVQNYNDQSSDFQPVEEGQNQVQRNNAKPSIDLSKGINNDFNTSKLAGSAQSIVPKVEGNTTNQASNSTQTNIASENQIKNQEAVTQSSQSQTNKITVSGSNNNVDSDPADDIANNFANSADTNKNKQTLSLDSIDHNKLRKLAENMTQMRTLSSLLGASFIQEDGDSFSDEDDSDDESSDDNLSDGDDSEYNDTSDEDTSDDTGDDTSDEDDSNDESSDDNPSDGDDSEYNDTSDGDTSDNTSDDTSDNSGDTGNKDDDKPTITSPDFVGINGHKADEIFAQVDPGSPSDKYVNPVTKQPLPANTVWITSHQIIEVRFKADNRLVKHEDTTVSFGRTVFFDKNGQIIGYSYGTENAKKAFQLNGNDPRTVVIGGRKISDMIGALANRYKITDDSIKQVKNWLVHPGSADQTFIIYLEDAPISHIITYYDHDEGDKVIFKRHIQGKPDQFVRDAYDYQSDLDLLDSENYVMSGESPFEGSMADTIGENADPNDKTHTGHTSVSMVHRTRGITRKHDVTRTVEYQVPDGYDAPDPSVQKVEFTRKGMEDLVTHKKTWRAWNANSLTFNQVNSPAIDGLRPDKQFIASVSVTPTSNNIREVVKYTPTTKNEEANPTRTIKYIVPNGDTPEPDVQTGKVTRTDHINSDGSVVPGPWKPEEGYTEVDSPVVDGYTTKTKSVPANEPKDDKNTTIEVVYSPNGHIIPVDQNGKPIEGADHPQYQTDYNDPSKVTPTDVPDIDGYTPSQTTVTPTDPTKDTQIIYTLTDPPVQHTRTINYVYSTGGTALPTKTQTANGTQSDPGDFDSLPVQVLQGYHTDVNEVPEVSADQDTTFTVTYTPNGKIIPVDENHSPISNTTQPKYRTDPDDPTNVTETQVPTVPGYTPSQSTVVPNNPSQDTQVVYTQNDPEVQHTRTIHYIYSDGSQPENTTHQAIKGHKSNPGYYTQVTVPAVQNYHADKAQIPSQLADQDQDITVTYKPNGHVIPVDPKGNPIPNVDHPQYQTDPDNPTTVTPTQAPTVPNYTPTQSVVNPPADPSQDTKVVYNITDPATQHTRTINFVYRSDGSQASDPVVQTIQGKQSNPGTFPSANVPNINGYHADMSMVPTDTADTDKNVTVYYEPNGHIIPVTSDGDPIPGADHPQYQNDPQDPTRPKNTPTPTVPGYTPTQRVVTPPEDPSQDVKIIYNENDPATEHTRTVDFLYPDGSQAKPTVKQTVKGHKSNPGTYDPLKVDVINGYYSDMSQVPGEVADKDDHVVVHYNKLGKIIPVDKDNKPIPNVDNPQYRNDPNNPGNTLPTNVPTITNYTPTQSQITPQNPGQDTRVIYNVTDPATQHTRTINFVYTDGSKASDPVVQTVQGTQSNPGTYPPANVPNIDGYHANKGMIPTDTAESNKSVTVTYAKNGKIIPVTPDGNPIPGADQPQYQNDPGDPTRPKNTPVPTVPDYTPTQKVVTPPKDPSQDVKVVYNPTDPATEHTRTIDFIYPDGSQAKPTVKQTVKGHQSNPGTYDPVNVDVINGYYADITQVPSESADKDDHVVVHYKKLGKIIPVDSQGNPIPNVDQPQYKNDPKNPGNVLPTDVPNIPNHTPTQSQITPSDPGKDTQVIYNVTDPDTQHTRTINFVYSDGSKASDPVIQTIQGKKSNPGTYPSANVPNINGYHADKGMVPTDTADTDKTVTVTYTKNGKIIPVDPNGTPIPGADQPQYQNDPNDPTKPKDTPTPNVPNYTPTEKTVTPPKDTSQDIKVIYNPTDPDTHYTRTIDFVYPDGSKAKPSVTQTVNGKKSRPGTYEAVNVDVINGYYSDINQVPSETADRDDHVVVHYKKLGKIIPVDKNGNPIPGAEQPQYKNDPKNPGSVLPTEPPKVSDYIPTIPQILPDNPGEDTKVPYDSTKNAQKRTLHVLVKYTYNTVNGPTAHPDDSWDLDQVSTHTDSQGQPIWAPDPMFEESKVKMPAIDGYEGNITNTETVGKSGKGYTYIIHVVYTKQPHAAISYNVHFIDEDNNSQDLEEPIKINAHVTDKVFDPTEKINEYVNKGYVLDKNPLPQGTDTIEMNNQTYNITFRHATQKVHGDVPNPTKNPDKAGQKLTQLAKEVPINTKYNYDTINGKQARPDSNQTIKYEADGEVDMVTGDVKKTSDFTPDSKPDDTIPTIDGYTGHFVDDNGNVTSDPDEALNNPNTTSLTRHVVYTANSIQYRVHFVDADEGNKELETPVNVTGKLTDNVYDPSSKINGYVQKGYVLDKNTLPSASSKDEKGMDGKDYYVSFKHGTKNVHGNVPNPSPNPDKHGKKITGLEKNVPIDTKYNYNSIDGQKARADTTQTIHMTADGVVDMVTGEVKRSSNFVPDNQPDNTIPVIDGYTGKFVDANGNPTSNPNSDLNNPNVTSITRHVVYTANAIQYKIHFIDEDNNNQDISAPLVINGHVNDIIYNPQSQIEQYQNAGYVLDKNNVPTGRATTVNDKQEYEITFRHGKKDVHGDVPNPSPNPDKHGQKLTQLAKEVPVNTKYNYDTVNGPKAHEDTTQTIKFEADGEVDMVTGEVKRTSDFAPDSQPTNDIPKIDGYTGQFVDENGKPVTNPNTALNDPNVSSVTRHVVYTADSVQYKVHFIDKDNNNQELETPVTVKGHVGDNTYDPSNEIKKFEDKGYTLADNNVPNGKNTLSVNGKDYYVSFKHGTQKVHGDVPNPSKNPDKAGKKISELAKEVPVNTEYHYDTVNGKKAFKDDTQLIKYEADGIVDMVTGKVTRTSDFEPDNKPTNTIPNIKGYTGQFTNKDGKPVQDPNAGLGPNASQINRYVVYTKNKERTSTDHIDFIDQVTGKPILTREINGVEGKPSGYTTRDDLSNLIKKGYKLVNDPTGGKNIIFTGKDMKYQITLGHQTQNVSRQKTVTRRVRYQVPSGYKDLPPVVQKLTFTDQGTKDLVTGKTTWNSEKNPITQNFSEVKSPDVDNLTPDKDKIDSENVTLSASNWNDPQDEDVVVTYHEDQTKGTPAKNENNGQDHQEPNYDGLATPKEQAIKDKQKPTKHGKVGDNHGGLRAPANNGGNYVNNNNGNRQSAQNSNSAMPHIVKAATISKPTQIVSRRANNQVLIKNNNQNTLPQTGSNDKQDLALMAMGAIISGMSLLGLYETKRRKYQR